MHDLLHLCKLCSRPVNGEMHACVKLLGKPGTAFEDFEYYHLRHPGDCWYQHCGSRSKSADPQPAAA
jgi:hypothetical protein